MMKNARVKIIGTGAVSGFGRGCDLLWQGLLNEESAIGPIRDITCSDLLPDWCVQIPADVSDIALTDFFEGYENDAFLRMCSLVLGEMLPEIGTKALVADNKELSVFLSTLKGNLPGFEKKMDASCCKDVVLQDILINSPAGILASALQAEGTTRTYSNACASGTTAVAMAAADIRHQRTRTSVVLGGDLFAYFIHTGFSCLKALSFNPCKPFDQDRDGLTLGEAFAGLHLERTLGNEGVQIMGWGFSNDANHITGPSRTGEGLRRAIKACLHDAGVAPDQVGAIVTHGTATRYNDAMELKAYQSVFGGSIPLLCGIKGAIGHTLGAAGIIETIVAMKIIEEQIVPATVGHESSNDPDIRFESRTLGSPIVLNCNSGFGGVNVAVLIGRPDEIR